MIRSIMRWVCLICAILFIGLAFGLPQWFPCGGLLDLLCIVAYKDRLIGLLLTSLILLCIAFIFDMIASFSKKVKRCLSLLEMLAAGLAGILTLGAILHFHVLNGGYLSFTVSLVGMTVCFQCVINGIIHFVQN